MTPNSLPSSDILRRAGRLITPRDASSDLDLSGIAELAAHDAACRILRIRQACQAAFEKIEAMEAADCDREIALGGGIERASEAGSDTAYREAIFQAICVHFDLSGDEARQYVERYRAMKSATKD